MRPLTLNQELTLKHWRDGKPPNPPEALTRANVFAGSGKWTSIGFDAVCRGLVTRGLAEEYGHSRSGWYGYRLTQAGLDMVAKLRAERPTRD